MDQRTATPGRLLAKNTLLNLLGMVLPVLVGITAIPFAIRGLGNEGFGILSIVWVLLGYFALLDSGLGRATTKFVSEIVGKKNDGSLARIVWTAVLSSFALGIAGTVVLASVTPYLADSLLKIPPSHVEEAKLSLYLGAGCLPFVLFSTSARGVLGAAQRFDLVNLVLVPASTLSYLFPALSLPLKLNLSTVVLLIILVRVAASFTYLLLCIKVFPGLKRKPGLHGVTLRRLFSYGGWVTVTGVISPILVYMDRFFIGSIVSVTAVAFYAAPFDAINRIRILPISIMKTFFPEFSKVSGVEDRERLELLTSRAAKYLLLSTGTIGIVLFHYAPEILRFWLGIEFAEKATTLFRVFALGIVVNSLAYVPFNLLQGIGRPDLPAKFHAVEFPVHLFMLWYLTKDFGINGAAAAWLVRISLDFLLLYGWTVRLYPNVMRRLREAKVLPEVLLLSILGVFLFVSKTFISNMFVSAMSVVIFLTVLGVVVWLYILDESERQLVNSLSRKVSSVNPSEKTE